MKSENHAVQNAQGWTKSIREMVAALECDYDRLQELREFKESEGLMNTEAMEELVELEQECRVDGDVMSDADAARERIQEAPLSVQVRTGWYTPGEEGVAEEFEILLSTGGPALRIMGELDEHKQPHRAWLEYQDWGTPWTHHYVEGFSDTLLTFCQQFYFGE